MWCLTVFYCQMYEQVRERQIIFYHHCFKTFKGSQTHLSVFKLHIQEVKVPEDPELLLWCGIVHIVWFPGPIIRGHQTRLVLHKVQFPATGEYHLQTHSIKKYCTKNKKKELKKQLCRKLRKQLYHNRRGRCILPKGSLWVPLLVHTETKHSPVFLAFFSVKKMETFNTKIRKSISQHNTIRRMELRWCHHCVKHTCSEAWTDCLANTAHPRSKKVTQQEDLLWHLFWMTFGIKYVLQLLNFRLFAEPLKKRER